MVSNNDMTTSIADKGKASSGTEREKMVQIPLRLSAQGCWRMCMLLPED